MQTIAIEGGFSDAPHQSSQAFRQIMNAIARPGTICTAEGAAPPAPMSVAAGTLILTLCDHETPIYLGDSHDTADIRAWIAFHTGAPVVPAAQAAFAIGRWEDLPLQQLPIGQSDYPDRAATVIVDAGALTAQGAVLTGPGIKGQAALSLPDRAMFQSNAKLFPLGLDFFFTHGSQIAGLPRTTKVS